MMTNSFSFQRFGHLIAKYATEQRRSLLLALVGLPAALSLISAFIGLASVDADPYMCVAFQNAMFIIVVTIGSLFVASTMFRSLDSASGAVSTLTLPVSTFEAFLVRWVAAVPVYLAVCLAGVVFADLVRLTVSEMSGATRTVSLVSALTEGNRVADDIIGFFSITRLLFLQSFFLLGGVVWRRNHFLKTLGAIWLIWLVYYLAGAGVSVAYAWYFDTAGFNFRSSFHPGLLMWGGIVLNYYLTYLRLREADVVQSW